MGMMRKTKIDRAMEELWWEKYQEESDLRYLVDLTPFEIYEHLVSEEAVKYFNKFYRREE
jgi:hypothetical protein